MAHASNPKSRRRAIAGAMILALATAALPLQAQQRDPAYAAARAAGQVGEKTDGYLGIVGASTPELRALVDDLNIKSRANYTERARAQSATLEEYAFTQGCVLILRTVPGEKYQAPGGTWQTRGTGAPERDSRCP